MIAVTGPIPPRLLEQDPSLRRVERWSGRLKYAVIASLALVVAGIVLSIAASQSWLVLIVVAALAWFLCARLAVRSFWRLHLDTYRWRLENGSPRERALLTLARRAVWSWTDEIPDEATHAVLVAEEIGGQPQVEAFIRAEAIEKRLAEPVDFLGRERRPVVVGLVELDAEPERAVIAVRGGRLGERRALDALPEAEDGWLVGG